MLASCASDEETGGPGSDVGSQDSAASAAVAPTPDASAGVGGGTAEDALFTALVAAGVPVDPAETTLQLIKGICTQLDSGADDSQIIANLMPVAAYAASRTEGQLTAGEVAEAYVANAKAHYC